MIEGDARYRKSKVGDLASGQRASSAIGNWSGFKKQRAVQEVWMEIQNQYGGRERILLSLFLLLCVWRCQKKKKKKKKKGGVHVHNQTTPASVPSISLTSFPLFQAPSPSSPPSFNPPARPPSHPLFAHPLFPNALHTMSDEYDFLFKGMYTAPTAYANSPGSTLLSPTRPKLTACTLN